MALRALIADDYADARGRTAADLRNALHGWLISHQSIRLITRIDSIEPEGTELARLQVTVGMLGRDAQAGAAWDLAADVQRLDLQLARDGGEWRVVRADWGRDR